MHTKRDNSHEKNKLHHVPGTIIHGLGDALPTMNPTPQTRVGAAVMASVLKTTENVSLPQDPLKYVTSGTLTLAGTVLKTADTVHTGLNIYNEAKELGANNAEATIAAASSSYAASKLHHHLEFELLEKIPKAVTKLGKLGRIVGTSVLVGPAAIPCVELSLNYYKLSQHHSKWKAGIGAFAGALGSFAYAVTGLSLIGLAVPEAATGIGTPLALAQGAAGCALLTFSGEAGTEISEATVHFLESLPTYYDHTLKAIEKVPGLFHSAEEYVSAQINKFKNNFNSKESHNLFKKINTEMVGHIAELRRHYQLKEEEVSGYLMVLSHAAGNVFQFNKGKFEIVKNPTNHTFSYVKKENLQMLNQFFDIHHYQSRGLGHMFKRIHSEIPSEQLRTLKKHIRQLPGGSEEMNRQKAELQQGEQLFNQAIGDMRKDPVGTANLLATIDVNNKAEEIHEQVEYVKRNLIELGVMQQAHAVKTEIKLDNLLDNTKILDKKLETLIENNQEVRQQLSVVIDNIKQQSEHKKIQENQQGIRDAIGFVGALGQYCGNQDLCRLSALAHTGATIASLAALQGPMTLASLSPISAVGVSILSLISAFAEKGPDINQIMLEAIQSLARQLDTLRKEIHERFDKIDTKLAQIYLRIIDGFCELTNQNKDIMEILTDIQSFLRDFKIEVKDYFSTMNESLLSIEDHLLVIGRQNKIETIYKTIQNADRMQNFNATEFKNLYNEFYSEICGLHKNNRLLVGGNKEGGFPVKFFELDEKNSFAADFNINALYDYLAPNKEEKRPDLVNPTIWSWQVMGYMELLKRFYEKKENSVNFITKAELKSLEEVPMIGYQTLNFLHRVRNKDLMLHLLDEHIKWGRELERELALFVSKEEKLKTKELNQQLRTSMKCYSNSNTDSILDDFNEQQIPFDTQITNKWFTAESYNSHQKFGKKHGQHYPYGTATNIQQKIEDYKQARQLAVDQKKTELRQEAQKKLLNFDNQFYYFNPSNLGDNYRYSFMFPQNRTHPILSLPKNIFFPIPQTLQMAQWLELGRVEFQYHIEQVEAKHAVAEVKDGLKQQNFVIEGIWNSGTGRNILFTFTIAYDPGVYGYKRVVFFAPLQKSSLNIDSKTILLHRYGGRITVHWQVDNLKYSKSMLESDAKEILAVLPEAGRESTDATLIRAITTKFGCTPKENEALWWWWQGGNCCVKGATYVSTIYSNTTREQNTWTHEANLPLCQGIRGKRDTLKLNNDPSNKAELKVHVSEDSELIRLIQQQMAEKQMILCEGFYENLHKEIKNNSVSSLGKAFLQYSNTYYMLKSALSLSFGESVLKSYPEFKYFYDTTVLSHRQRFLSQLALDKNDISLTEKLKTDLQTGEAQVKKGLTKLFSEPHPDSWLALVLKEWNDLMKWYKQHAVDENNLCSSKAVEEMQREQLNTYGVFMECLSNALLSCKPQARSELEKAMQQQMLKQGIALTGNAQASLEFKLDSSSKEYKSPNGSLGFFKNKQPISNPWATGEGISDALKKELKETVHIIHPDLSSTCNLFFGEKKKKEEAAVDYAKQINAYVSLENGQETKKATNGFIQADGGVLKKPIVAILNTGSVRVAHAADANATGGVHWVTMVILPKNYILPKSNKELKNKNERIFFLDSRDPKREFPTLFKRILVKGYTYSFPVPVNERSKETVTAHHKILPAFPTAEFADLSEFKLQQTNGDDCGYHALDNAIKIVKFGTIAAIMKDYKRPKPADALRRKYPDLNKESSQRSFKN